MGSAYEAVKDQDSQQDNPKQSAGLLSLLTFSWLTGLVESGKLRPLNTVDLFPLLSEDRSEQVTSKLERSWQRAADTAGTACRQSNGGLRLVRALMDITPTHEYCLITALLLIDAIARLAQPLFLVGLLDILMGDHQPDAAGPRYWKSFFYAAAISISAFAITLSRVHWEFRTSLVGMRIRSALLGLMYKKVLCLSTYDLADMTSGHVINLISNDVDRFDQAVTFLPGVISAPFTVTVACSLCLYLIGWCVLPGFAFLVLLIGYQSKAVTLVSNLRKKAAERGDCRLKVLREIISGIRAVKMSTWERHFMTKVQGLRRSEILSVRKISIIFASFSALTVTSQGLVSLMIFLALLLTGSALSPTNIFLIFSYVYLLKDDISFYLANGLSEVTQCYMTAGRIEAFLKAVDASMEQKTGYVCFDGFDSHTLSMEQSLPKHETSPLLSPRHDICHGSGKAASPRAQPHVWFSDATCFVENKPILRNINVQMKDSVFVAVSGPVGCGKSALLLAMLGELPANSGQLRRSGKVAYVPQTPWVFSGTFRENILCYKEYNPQRYTEVIKVCALEKDVGLFPGGDLTMLGERGVVLSGGQRARIGLARAVYSNADIYFLDDPLSSVDAEVARHILEQCICSMLRDRVRVLVTHQMHFLKYADNVLLMEEGTVKWSGKYAEMPDHTSKGSNSDSNPLAKETSHPHMEVASMRRSNTHAGAASVVAEEGLSISEEDRNFGSVSYDTYWQYIKAARFGCFTIPIFLLLTFAQVFRPAPDWWLGTWNDVTWSSADDRYSIFIYIGLVLSLLVVSFASCLLLYELVINSAKNLHDDMVSSVLRAPVLFFDTNPSGRILNRFSKDVGVLDEKLPVTQHEYFQTSFMLAMSVLIPIATNYWVVIAGMPLVALTLYYGRGSIRVSREVARLDAINRSFVYSQFSSTLEGMVTIRAQNKQDKCTEQFYRYQDELVKTWFVSISTVRWLQLRLDMMSSAFMTFVVFTALITSQRAGSTGLAAIYSSRLLGTLTDLVQLSFHFENMMTSAERVLTYTRLESEPGDVKHPECPDDWPKDADIEFENLSLIYYPKGPQVLKNLSFAVKSKEKLGIVGRTGAGKSSIIAALMRMPEPSGTIRIDGCDVQRFALSSYRSRLSVISQDPVLFSGTLRDNLDPASSSRDVQLWEALEAVHLRPLVESLEGQLYYELTEGGSNFSSGQRQLICLARALLQGNKIIVLDEATANVDFATDHQIQEMLCTRFKRCTVLTVAHRVRTILDYDRVLVLEEGRLVELDRPEKLMAMENGKFAELCRHYHATV